MSRLSRRRSCGSCSGRGVEILQPELLVLLLVGALHWAAHAPYVVLLGVHVQDLALTPTVAGTAVCLAVGAEVAVFLVAPRVVRALSPVAAIRWTLLVGMVRWVITAHSSSAAVLVVTQGLHGITYGLYFVVSAAVVHRAVPEQARSTGQAALMAIVFGAGGILGNLACGLVYEAGGGHAMFLTSAVLELVACGVSLLIGSQYVRVGTRGE